MKIKKFLYLFVLRRMWKDKDLPLTGKQLSQIDGLMYKVNIMSFHKGKDC